MRIIVIVFGMLMIASVAGASGWGGHGGVMGVFFSDTEFTEENRSIDTSEVPFQLYIVFLESEVTNVGGYECSLEFSDPGVFVLAATGPNGWTNFGDQTNHLVGYVNEIPVDLGGGVVLSTLTLLYQGTEEVDIIMGPSSPSSGGPIDFDGPIIGSWVGGEPILYTCDLTSGASGYPDVVAWLNRTVLAVEDRSWTGIKNLFD